MSSKIEWKELTELNDLEQVGALSSRTPVVLYKHSTRCGLSHDVKRSLEEDWKGVVSSVDFFQLDILAHRSISDRIAERWNVPHQSPQILLIYRDELVYEGSHHAVSAERIERALSELSQPQSYGSAE